MKPTAPARPKSRSNPRRVIDNQTVAAVLERGTFLLALARRYSACAADAEDAYQRSLEILMTKAPSADVEELLSWMTTVVRNEALAIVRRNARIQNPMPANWELTARSDAVEPEEHLDNVILAQAGAEALRAVHVDVTRCMLLKAEGFSYAEIIGTTGFTHRKVERCMVEGRQSLSQRLVEIRDGSHCARIEPLLHRIVEGDTAALKDARPHLRHCGHCRAVMREFHEAPKQLVAALPVGALVASHGLFDQVIGVLQHAVSVAHERIVWHGYGTRQWFELAGAKQAATAIAATAAIAGGGAVANHSAATPSANSSQAPATRNKRSETNRPLFKRSPVVPTQPSQPAPPDTQERDSLVPEGSSVPESPASRAHRSPSEPSSDSPDVQSGGNELAP